MRARSKIKGCYSMLAKCANKFLIINFSFLIFSLSARAQDSVLRVKVTDDVWVEMVRVEGGTFTMGSNATPKGVRLTYALAGPEHNVTVDGYWIGRYEVTQDLWEAVMGSNPSKFKGEGMPVECVSWEDAQRFCMMLSQLTGKHFRLPTEAEWEFAARGRTRTTAFPGCERGELGEFCWYCVNGEGHTHAVGQLKPNVLGLYDMGGNVAEWCQDWVEEYSKEAQTNPRGPKTGENRVLRGGHYGSTSAACTVYDRGWYLPTGRYEFYGLRLVMEESNED